MWSLYHTETDVMGFLAKMGSAGPGQAGQCPEGRCPEEKGFQSTLVKFGQGAGPHRQPKAVPPSGPAPPHRAQGCQTYRPLGRSCFLGPHSVAGMVWRLRRACLTPGGRGAARAASSLGSPGGRGPLFSSLPLLLGATPHPSSWCPWLFS